MDALTCSRELIQFDSTSRISNLPVIDHLEAMLKRQDFEIERIEYDDAQGVRKANLIGKKGRGRGGMAYFGHTDVVPADSWFSDEHGPFDPIVKGDRLYGRGSSDMKGSIACMLTAAERFMDKDLKSPLYIACTADEEIGYGGALQIAGRSELFREMVRDGTRGIIGEPTMLEVVHAHKGTCGFIATSRGKAAHSSTREGINANLAMIPFLAEMKKIHDETESDPAWRHDEFDPPTITVNIGINDHTRALNITPAQSICTVSFRVMPGQDPDVLIERARSAAKRCGLEFEVRIRSKPLYVDPKSDFVGELVRLPGTSAPRTVPYATDASALTDLEKLVILGPGDIAQAHTHDEWVAQEQLERGTELYAGLVRHWCA